MGETGAFHARLRSCVAGSGMVVKEIAALAGVNKRTMDKWLSLSDPKMPGADDAASVAKALGVSVEYLVYGDGPPSIPARLQELVDDLALLPPNRLEDVARLVRPWADEARRSLKREAAAS